jgi:hypothetical protein
MTVAMSGPKGLTLTLSGAPKQTGEFGYAVAAMQGKDVASMAGTILVR